MGGYISKQSVNTLLGANGQNYTVIYSDLSTLLTLVENGELTIMNNALEYKGIVPVIDPDKAEKYRYLKGRVLKNTDIALYVYNYAADHNKSVDELEIDVKLLSEIVDHSLDLEIFFRS